MEENLKTRIILVLVILNIIFILSTISLSGKLRKKERTYQKELKVRIETEEKMQNLSGKLAHLQEANKLLEDKLIKGKDAYKLTEKQLRREKKKSETLQKELGKLKILKETLEEDLKEALMSGKRRKR